MNLSCGCFLWCCLFGLLLFSLILIHLSILCHFNSCEVDYWSRIRSFPGVGVLVCQFYLIFLKFHHKFYINLLQREGSFISHHVIHWRPDKNVYGRFSSTTFWLENHHRVVGPCSNQLNRCKCVLWNLIDYFWRFLDGGYTRLCIYYPVGRAEG